MRAARHAEETAEASLDVVQKQLNAGQVNQLAVLNAQQTYLTASVIRVQTEPIVSPIPQPCSWHLAAAGLLPAQHRFGGIARWEKAPACLTSEGRRD